MTLSCSVQVLIVLSAAVFIVRQLSVVLKKKFIRLITTPLITYFICGIAVAGIFSGSSGRDWMILAALGLSLIADSVLMIENADLLTHGLLFFLGTHVLYNIVFSENYSFIMFDIPLALLLLGLMGFLVYRFFRGGKLGSMLIPVVVYITALSLIVFFSINGYIRDRESVSFLRMSGAVLFYISDVILGWTQFVKYYRFATLYVWFFYAPGQFLIALSLLYQGQ